MRAAILKRFFDGGQGVLREDGVLGYYWLLHCLLSTGQSLIYESMDEGRIDEVWLLNCGDKVFLTLDAFAGNVSIEIEEVESR